MQTKTSALLLAAFCGFAVLAPGSAAAREDTGLEGHWGGDLVSLKTGEKSSAELTLDHYGCYALSIKRDPGIETGLYRSGRQGCSEDNERREAAHLHR